MLLPWGFFFKNCMYIWLWAKMVKIYRKDIFLIILKGLGLGLWCLTPLSSFQQYFRHILAVNFIGGGNRSTRQKNHWPATSHWQTLSHSVVSSTPPWMGFELTTLVLIGTDCIGSYKSNYHTITAKTALLIILKSVSMTVMYESLYTYWENFYYFTLCPTYPTIPQRWTFYQYLDYVAQGRYWSLYPRGNGSQRWENFYYSKHSVIGFSCCNWQSVRNNNNLSRILN